MVGNDDEQPSLSIRVCTVEGRLGAFESTIDSMVQEIKRLSLKFDDRGLADGADRSGRNHSSGNPHPHPPPQQNPLQQPPPQSQPITLHQHPQQPSPPPKRPPRNFQYETISDEDELNDTFLQEDDYEDEAYDRRVAYGRSPRRMTNPNPNKGGGFPFPDHDRRRGDSSPSEYRMKIEILFFSENIDIKSFLDWVYEVEKFFDVAYFSRKSISSSWPTSSRKEPPHDGNNWRSQEDVKASYPWWREDTWNNVYKVDSFHPTINKFFTISLNITNKVQGLLRRTRKSYIASYYGANYPWRIYNKQPSTSTG